MGPGRRRRRAPEQRYGFASTDAKTNDYFFTGFPSYWNIVALYLFARGLPPAVNAVILLAFSALVFVRIGYVYPSRTPVLRGLTIAGAVWDTADAGIILLLPTSPGCSIASLFFPVYYTVLSFVAARRRGAAARMRPMTKRRGRCATAIAAVIFVRAGRVRRSRDVDAAPGVRRVQADARRWRHLVSRG